MLLPRLIPVLLVDDQLNLVKTTSFDHPHYLGDPLNAAYVFSGFEVYELLLLDIDASPQGRSIPFRFVEALARFARVPLCVGGGITKLEQIHDLLALGVEKVALSSVLNRDFTFLHQAVDRFGSSTISVVLNCLEPSGISSDLSSVLAFFGRPDDANGSQLLLNVPWLAKRLALVSLCSTTCSVMAIALVMPCLSSLRSIASSRSLLSDWGDVALLPIFPNC